MSKIFEEYGNEMRAEGAMGKLLENIKSLMGNLNWTMEQAMDALSVPPEERPVIQSRMANL